MKVKCFDPKPKMTDSNCANIVQATPSVPQAFQICYDEMGRNC